MSSIEGKNAAIIEHITAAEEGYTRALKALVRCKLSALSANRIQRLMEDVRIAHEFARLEQRRWKTGEATAERVLIAYERLNVWIDQLARYAATATQDEQGDKHAKPN